MNGLEEVRVTHIRVVEVGAGNGGIIIIDVTELARLECLLVEGESFFPTTGCDFGFGLPYQSVITLRQRCGRDYEEKDDQYGGAHSHISTS
jgi:hypothetical protein